MGYLVEFLVIKVLARLFPKRYRLIPRVGDAAPLLRQFKVCNWIYLQSFVNPEIREWFHVHRHRYTLSVVLSGLFVEERYPGNIFKVHMWGNVYTMDDTNIHRIDHVRLRTWTIFFMFGKNKQFNVADAGWGYYQRPDKNGNFIPEKEVIVNRVPSL